MQLSRFKLTTRRSMIAVALVALIFGANAWGVKMKHRRSEGWRIAFLYKTYAKSARSMFDHYELEACNHRKLAAEKRTEARDSQGQNLRMILEDLAKDADKRAEYWSGRARPYHEQAEAYSKLSQMFEQAASRPWKPLPPIPEEWPLTFQ